MAGPAWTAGRILLCSVLALVLISTTAHAAPDGGYPDQPDLVDVELAAGVQTDGGTFSVEGGVWWSTPRYLAKMQQLADLRGQVADYQAKLDQGPGARWVSTSFVVGLAAGVVLSLAGGVWGVVEAYRAGLWRFP